MFAVLFKPCAYLVGAKCFGADAQSKAAKLFEPLAALVSGVGIVEVDNEGVSGLFEAFFNDSCNGGVFEDAGLVAVN